MNKRTIVFLLALLSISCSKWDDFWDKEDKTNDDPDLFVDENGQLYNMNFDLWYKDGSYYECYGEDATEGQMKVWGSANSTTAKLGKYTCYPDSVFLAVPGADKHAVVLKTQMVSAFFSKKLASGSIFTGQMGSIKLKNLSATLKWGIPFNLRPKALEGYACYKPVPIDVVHAPYENMKDSLDIGHVFVLLTDWESQFTVDPGADKFVDIENDPAIIGYGRVAFDHTMDEYEHFTLTIDYRNERTPKYVVIVASSSAMGDYFTGGVGSTLYLDEFKFLY
jgi:hypothetical protein